MHEHYNIILKEQEKRVGHLLEWQIKDRASFEQGGFIDPQDGLVHPVRASEYLAVLAPLYLNKDSIYFKNERLYDKILCILNYMERVQRHDGTFDLIVTNFYSSPDTGFIVHNLANVYRIVKRDTIGKRTERINRQLYEIIEKSGYGMVNGGFHTPNHRWVIASALMMAYNITGRSNFENMAQRYLDEGIDCDENGEFTERSSGIYNATNDNALIILSQEMNREDFLEHVKRNLNMMLMYMEPDGSVFTQNSTRQDRENQCYPVCYYPVFLYMAYMQKDGRYANMADMIFRHSYLTGEVPSLLSLFMMYPELKKLEIKKIPVPTVYDVFYEKSGIARIRREDLSFTVLKGNSRFLFFQSGRLSCYMKLCASFFASAQFRADKLIKIKDEYKLEFVSHGFYHMPFEERPVSSDWAKMDHKKRERVNELKLVFHVTIKEIKDGLNVHIVTEGCDRVPIKVEICFLPDCLIQGETYFLQGEPGGKIIVKSGYIKVGKGVDWICAGPGFGKHMYISQMRGSEPQSTSGFTIYFTDYTHMNRNITLTRQKALPATEGFIR